MVFVCRVLCCLVVFVCVVYFGLVLFGVVDLLFCWYRMMFLFWFWLGSTDDVLFVARLCWFSWILIAVEFAFADHLF